MRFSWKHILKFACIVCTCLFVFAVIGSGDVGDFNDYDSGSSWSSSSSDSGSSWSWGSDSSSDNHKYSSRRNSDKYFTDDAVPPEDSSWSGIFSLLLLVFIFIVIAIYQQQNQPAQPIRVVKWPDVPDNSFEITQAISEQDPAFNATAFLEWAKAVFFKLQYAWMDRDWEQVRPFESEELFATHARQLQEYKRLGRINMLERINVNNAYFFSLIKDQAWETLSVVMHVRMVDYIVDEHTRKVLKGDPNRDCFLSYFYIFKRKAGVKTTSAKQGVDTIACPNCGAPTHVVSSGKCEYCNFVITVKDHGWVLTDIIGIKPPYDYGTGGVIIQDKPEE